MIVKLTPILQDRYVAEESGHEEFEANKIAGFYFWSIILAPSMADRPALRVAVAQKAQKDLLGALRAPSCNVLLL